MKKIITALNLLVFDRKGFIQRVLSGFFGRHDIFLFYVKAKIRSYFLRCKKRLFIDLGANIGQGYQFFRGIYPNRHYDYILVEPNKFCAERLNVLAKKEKRVIVLQAAAWTNNDMKLFYGIAESRNNTTLGASLVKEHKTKTYDSKDETAVLVETFDFSEFLFKKKEIYDEIIVKMDVESSEYDILEKLIDDSSIKCIDRLFVEFHTNWMKESEIKVSYEMRESELINILPKLTKFHVWV
ncbi:MAG: FkbM family methyltransferase [Bacteroidota bacterium]|nr:FkbM family methyltransferase [Bacteroidota bacterium]